jgi:hypothetical protein
LNVVKTTTKKATCGYTHCACRDCFDVAISANTAKPALCGLCKEAGCDHQGARECARLDAYEDDAA